MINKVISKNVRFSCNTIRMHHPNCCRLQWCRQHLYLFFWWIQSIFKENHHGYLAITPIFGCKMTDRRTRQSQFLVNTSQAEQKYSADGKIRIHICARYAYFQSCGRWRTWGRRYYSDGCCSRIVAICNCVGGPERFSAYKALITIDCWDKLIQHWVRTWIYFR